MAVPSAPRVALGPDPVPDWAVTAVEAGGGAVVGPEDAEALVWLQPGTDPGALPALLAAAPQVRWVQLPWAGVEDYAAAGLFDDGRQWTCGKGVYAEPVAELAHAMLVAGLRHLPQYARADRWTPQAGLSLYDGKVTVLGGGGITEALVALLAPWRVEVTVVRRRPVPMAGVARVVGPEDLDAALGTADGVVVALALTPETTGIVDRGRLEAMRSHAWLVNVARGRHVVTDDLVAALSSGVIGGAALDVTDPEPLPDGHALFGLPNCLITPHTGNTREMARAPLTARITENVRRFGAGEALIGPVDAQKGY